MKFSVRVLYEGSRKDKDSIKVLYKYLPVVIPDVLVRFVLTISHASQVQINLRYVY